MSIKLRLSLLSLAVFIALTANGQDATNNPAAESAELNLNPDVTITNISDAASKTLLDRESAMVNWLARADVSEADSPSKNIQKLQKEANFQSRVGNNAGAIDIYDKILEMDPDNKGALFSKGTILIKMDRYEEALEILTALAEDNTDDYFILNNIAWIFATASDINIRNGKKAVSLAREALLQAPNDYHVWNTLSEAYFISAKYEKALETARIALQIAIANGEPNERLQNLAEQARKCKQASVTMSIME